MLPDGALPDRTLPAGAVAPAAISGGALPEVPDDSAFSPVNKGWLQHLVNDSI